VVRRIENPAERLVWDRVREKMRAHVTAFINRAINAAAFFL
jgi:hypothetical protein